MYGNIATDVKAATPVTLAIIAGGQGTRFGHVAKGLIRLGNSTLIERLITQSPTQLILVNSNQAEPYAFLDVPVVGDLLPQHGAPGGVATALAFAGTSWVLVVAADMPNVTRSVMETLIAGCRDDCDVVCGQRYGELEPLLAVYRASLWRSWVTQLEAPRAPSLRDLIRQARVNLIDVADDSVFDSINTPAELDRWRQTNEQQVASGSVSSSHGEDV